MTFAATLILSLVAGLWFGPWVGLPLAVAFLLGQLEGQRRP